MTGKSASRRGPSAWLLLPLLVVGALIAVLAGTRNEPEGQAKPGAGPKPAHVEVTRLESRPFISEQRFLGEVWAVSDASMTVGEEGRVRRVHVVEGDRVKGGQLLLELDDRLARAELSAAVASEQRVEAEADNATREAERYRQLSQERVVTDIETQRQVTEATALTAQKTAASATVGVQNERVQRHRIVAPFDGIVARRNVDPGDWLKPGEPALQLLTDERVEVLVNIPADLLTSLDRVEGVQLVEAEHRAEARITSAVDALDRETRTALVRVEASERPRWLRAGASVEVAFQVRRDDGLVVPRDALIFGIVGVSVARVNDGKAELVPVDVRETAQDTALISSKDLTIGDQLVIRGNERLRPGQPVLIGEALSGVTAEAASLSEESVEGAPVAPSAPSASPPSGSKPSP